MENRDQLHKFALYLQANDARIYDETCHEMFPPGVVEVSKRDFDACYARRAVEGFLAYERT